MLAVHGPRGARPVLTPMLFSGSMTTPTPGVISAAGTPPAEQTSVKDTVISVLISLVLAFVFRGFVVEAFQIPTGSMAPTLLGAHMRFRSPVTGAEWTVAPWEYQGDGFDFPKREQTGSPEGPIVVHDPMSNYEIRPSSMRTLAGDRIFVLKYLYSIFDPARFDVVVFKNPQNPQENFIKRLIGLPGEQIALVDGDVFVRPASMASQADGENAWAQPGWTIARKPERVQRAVWQPVFESQYTPKESRTDQRQWFFCPWKPSTGGWEMTDRPTYRYGESKPTRLDWDFEHWPLVDRYAYNEAFLRGSGGPSTVLLGSWWKPTYHFEGPMFYYPVSDLRVAAGIQPDSPDLECAINLVARGHQFQARLGKGKITLNMRPQPASETADEPWKTLASLDKADLFAKDRVTNVEFWHVDQALQVWVDGDLVLRAEYNWSPAERIRNATGLDVEQIVESSHDSTKPGVLIDGTKYRLPGLSMAFDGAAVTLQRVGVWRDLHYQATIKGSTRAAPGLATAPDSVLTTGPDHFFCCGDNSPSSFDGRSWTQVEPWVAAEIDPTPGVVHRNLLIGKAFFVYFPAMDNSRRIPMPDFGRMRLIW